MSEKTLKELIDIFQPNGIDWLGDKITDDNPITYHHIVKKACGGRKSVDNGALLTKRSHQFLHLVIEQKNEPIYSLINYQFKELNKTKRPPTQDYYDNMSDLLGDYKQEMWKSGKVKKLGKRR